MLTPWLIVFRLKGGGAATLVGPTSGEKIRFIAYWLRSMPKRFSRALLTSRIWMSSTISARGRSLARISRSTTSITGEVARTVMVFAVLFGITIGGTGIWGMRMTLLIRLASSVASAWLMKNTRITRSSYCWCFAGWSGMMMIVFGPVTL